MGKCYSFDHIAEDCIHTDVTCNIEEPQQKYRLGTVSNGGGGGGGGAYTCTSFTGSKLSKLSHLACAVVQNIWSA